MTLVAYVPQICAPDIVAEAVSGVHGRHGPAWPFDGGLLINPDSDYALRAAELPDWDDAGGSGMVAYGTISGAVNSGLTGDKTLGCRVNVTSDREDCVLWEIANMRFECIRTATKWRPAVRIVTPVVVTTLTGPELDFGVTQLWASYDAAAGDLKLYGGAWGDTELLDETSFSEARNTSLALPIWQVGAPPGCWITDCAAWDSVLDFTVPPTVTINQGSGQADPANGSSIVFDVVFSEAVTGFATGDVALSGTAGGTLVGTVSGSGTTYTVTVTGMTTNGTVIASIAAGVCTGSVTGLPNEASTSTDNTVTWSLQYTDDFNRADSTTLGASWVETTGTALRINTNRMDNGTTAPSASVGRAWWNAALTDDHFVEWDISLLSGNGPSFYFGCNSTAPSTGYEIYWESTASGTFFLRRGNPLGTLTAVTSQNTVGTISGKRLRIERENGSDIRIYVDGVLKVSWSDSTYPTGQYVGIRIDNNAARVDNFTCGAL